MTRGGTFWRGVPQAIGWLQKKKWQKKWLQEEWDRKGGKKGGCRRSRTDKVAEKVAAAEIVGKANPEKKGGDNIGRER